MPKEYFKLENTTSLNTLKKGASVHIIGVCGVAMAQLAMLLDSKGYTVSGSDKEFYEPMGSLLRSSSIKLFEGYKADNIQGKPDLVVIGNSISYGNAEVDVVEQKRLPYASFPQILAETVIADRHSIVVSGTHGKSTTSAMLVGMLNVLKLNPSYFIGGVVEGLDLSLHEGKGDVSVVEGDEYDSAFFAKIPKFAFYKPQTLIVNAIEFDHADIYIDLNAINKEFKKLVTSVPHDGHVICCIDYENVRHELAEWRKSTQCEFITFGESNDADYSISSSEQTGLSQKISVKVKDGSNFTFLLPLPGLFNAKNALASLITAGVLGIKDKAARSALENFKGIKRRQQLRFKNEKLMIIEDFAHHPTAVSQTIAAFKSSFPDKRLIAVFEPRSNTSRRKIFQADYIEAFRKADLAVLCNVSGRENDQGHELLDVQILSEEINKTGVPSVCLQDSREIEQYLLNNTSTNDVVLIMSNGSFGGLIDNLLLALSGNR